MRMVKAILVRTAVLFAILIVLWFAMQFLGTPWGYMSFWYRTNNYLNRYFDTSVSISNLYYDCKTKSYGGEFRITKCSEEHFRIYEYGRFDTEKVLINDYYASKWSSELTHYYHDRHASICPIIHVPFDKQNALSFSSANAIPCVFDLEASNQSVPQIIITISKVSDLDNERFLQALYSLIVDIRQIFSQSTLHVYLQNSLIKLSWTDPEWSESYTPFVTYINQFYPDLLVSINQ